ncbi:hypothetical protein KR009_005892 [Drosophila setifemur]|nr:hypothetical protein KR009_005892 [Drosophila setifemur]
MDIFESFCRTCGNECLEALNIFEKSVPMQDKLVPVAGMLATFLPATLPPLDAADDYPKQICRICLKKLTLAYEFHQQWLGAHSEFNVALKFEQRRKRSLAGKPKPKVAPKPAEVLPEFTEDVGSSAADETISNMNPSFKCGICDERFHTEKACKFHSKFSHKDL